MIKPVKERFENGILISLITASPALLVFKNKVQQWHIPVQKSLKVKNCL